MHLCRRPDKTGTRAWLLAPSHLAAPVLTHAALDKTSRSAELRGPTKHADTGAGKGRCKQTCEGSLT